MVRIGACWLSTSLMKDVQEAGILLAMFTDHNPLLWKLRIPQKKRSWRLKSSHLKDKKFVEEIKKEMKIFFEQNIQPEMSILMVWETSKVFFRGLAIRHAARKRREWNKKYEELGGNVRNLERESKLNATVNNLKIKIKLVQCEINVLLSAQVAEKIKF